MFSFLKTAISLGSTTFSLAKVIAVAVPLLIASHTGTWFMAKHVGHTLGVSEEKGRAAAAAVVLQEQHSKWLVETAEASAKAEAENAKIVAENAVVGTELDREISKLSDSPVCWSSAVLRGFARLR